MTKLDRDNFVRAVEAADGKVSGSVEAVGLLLIKPSVLSSRIKSMNIRWVIRYFV